MALPIGAQQEMEKLMDELEGWTEVKAILNSIFDVFRKRAEGPAEIQQLQQQLHDTARDIATFVERADNIATFLDRPSDSKILTIPRCLMREESDSLLRELKRACILADGRRNQTWGNYLRTIFLRSDPQLRHELQEACGSLRSLLSNFDVIISACDAMVAKEHLSRAVILFNREGKQVAEAQCQSDSRGFDRLTEKFGQRLSEDQNEKVLRLCSQFYYTNGEYFALGNGGGTKIDIQITGHPDGHNDQGKGKRKRGPIDRTCDNGATATLKMSCDGKFYFYIFHSTGAEFRDDFSRNLRLIYPVNENQNNASPGELIPREHEIARRVRQFANSERKFPDSGDDVEHKLSAKKCPSMLMLYVALTRRRIEFPTNAEDGSRGGSRERHATEWIFNNMQCAEAVVKRINILVKAEK